MSVDLPAPFWPSKPKISPGSIVRETPFKASTGPYRFHKSTVDIACWLGTPGSRLVVFWPLSQES